MNMFWLDYDLDECAKMYVDKHVVKMPVEFAQLLSTVNRLEGLNEGYRLSHINNPCRIWASQSLENWLLLRELARAVGREYTYRYGKVHKSIEVIESLTIPNLPRKGVTQPPLCMPYVYKDYSDVIQSYRNYYVGDKYYFASWKNRETPRWFDSMLKQVSEYHRNMIDEELNSEEKQIIRNLISDIRQELKHSEKGLFIKVNCEGELSTVNGFIKLENSFLFSRNCDIKVYYEGIGKRNKLFSTFFDREILGECYITKHNKQFSKFLDDDVLIENILTNLLFNPNRRRILKMSHNEGVGISKNVLGELLSLYCRKSSSIVEVNPLGLFKEIEYFPSYFKDFTKEELNGKCCVAYDSKDTSVNEILTALACRKITGEAFIYGNTPDGYLGYIERAELLSASVRDKGFYYNSYNKYPKSIKRIYQEELTIEESDVSKGHYLLSNSVITLFVRAEDDKSVQIFTVTGQNNKVEYLPIVKNFSLYEYCMSVIANHSESIR